MNLRRMVFDLTRLFFRKSRVLTAIQHIARLRKPAKRFWTWEVYSLGAALRRVFNLGWRQPLCFGSDHGVSLATAPSDIEEGMGPAPYVTWSSWRASLKFSDSRLVYRVQHPWVPFRKLKGYSMSPKAHGTLVFVPHSVPGLNYEQFDLESFIAMVNRLPDVFHPLTFCLQFHDANVRSAILIAKSGAKVVTLGNSLSLSFVDRFYSLVRGYEYATSPSAGSQLFYCHELGVKYFLFDPEKKFQRRLEPTEGLVLPNDEIVQRIEEAFDFSNISTHQRQRNLIVDEGLGLDLEAADWYGYRSLLEDYKGNELRG